jgi:hypothetical protein
VHDVEAEAAAEDGAGHDPHVRPPARPGRRHCSQTLRRRCSRDWVAGTTRMPPWRGVEDFGAEVE